MPCTLDFEHQCRRNGARLVAGVDEAGRGCLAGPVFAAAVILPADFAHPTLTDSKQLAPEAREAIYAELRSNPRVIASCASATVGEIESLNILRASHLAMHRALEALAVAPDAVLIDGLPVRNFGFVHRAIVCGDELSLSIAAASVIAKVERDRLMASLALEFPGYGFERHKGYATPGHREALMKHGPCAHHRRTFEPVAQMVFDL